MATQQFKGNTAGQVGREPRTYTIKCTDTLNQITSANWFQGLLTCVDPIKPTDKIEILYGANSQYFGIFRPTINGNQITLTAWANPSNITGAIVSGNFPKFSGTSGLQVDSGISPSNAAKTKAVMADAALVVGNLVQATDTAGTVGDAGLAIKTGVTSSWGGGGTTHTFTATGLTSAWSAVANIVTATTADAAVVSAIPGTDNIAVTFTKDPGAGTTVKWIATK